VGFGAGMKTRKRLSASSHLGRKIKEKEREKELCVYAHN
jgi:hypothetical protein